MVVLRLSLTKFIAYRRLWFAVSFKVLLKSLSFVLMPDRERC